MPAITTPVYENMTEIYENYRVPARFIMFEGHVYKFIRPESEKEVKIHHYRCEAERHNLRIRLINGKPYHVEGNYKIAG